MSDRAECLPATGRSPSLALHATVLLLLLLVVLPVVRWRGVFTSDEGAGIAQAKALSDGSFGIPHPFPAADPSGFEFPYRSAGEGEDGFSPLPKRFTYSGLLSVADRVGGVPAMIVLSIAGTVIAALLTAHLASQVDPSLGVPAFWLVGLASPLFIDGFLVLGHSIAAAAAAAALLAVRRVMKQPSAVGLLLLASILAAGGLIRAEATLFGAALAVAVAVLGWARADSRLGVIAGVSMLGVAGGWALDRTITAHVIGSGAIPIPAATDQGVRGFLTERLEGLTTTWLRPGYGPFSASWLLPITIVLLGLVAARLSRQTYPDIRVLRALSITVVALALVMALTYSVAAPYVVPGLLIAFPAGVWGIAALDRASLKSSAAMLLALTGGLFALAVLATQYAEGGGWEWGGRYFAIGLPCAAPLAAAGLRNAARRLDVETYRVCLAAVVAPSIALGAMGVSSVRSIRHGWNSFADTIVEIAESTEAGDGGDPVVVTTESDLPRAAWDHMGASRWLLVSRSEDGLPPTLARLHQLDIEQLVVVGRGPDPLRFIETSPYVLEGSADAPADGAWWVRVLIAR